MPANWTYLTFQWPLFQAILVVYVSANGLLYEIWHLELLKAYGAIISSQSYFLLLLHLGTISQIVSVAFLLLSVYWPHLSPKWFYAPVCNKQKMTGIDAIAEEGYFAEEAKCEDNTCSNCNLDKGTDDALGEGFLVRLVFNAEIHFLLKTSQRISLIGLFFDDFLRDWSLFFTWNGSIEVVFESFRNSFYSDDNSPKSWRYILPDFNVGTREFYAVPLLHLYFGWT